VIVSANVSTPSIQRGVTTPSDRVETASAIGARSDLVGLLAIRSDMRRTRDWLEAARMLT